MSTIRTSTTDDRRSASRMPGRPPHPQAGFALVTVIIVLGALAFLLLSTTVAMRTTVRHATTSEAALRALLAADSGIELGIDQLLDAARRNQQRQLAGTRIACATPDGSQLRIAFADESGKIDINIAKPELLMALLLGLGLDSEDAARVHDSIADYRDSDDQRRPLGSERAEYRAVGRSGPANAAFGSIDELALVLGVTPDLQRRLLPFITVGSGLQGIDQQHASETLKAMLAGGADRESGASDDGRARTGRPLKPVFLAASVYRSFTIHASARTREGAVAIREATVEIVAARRPPGVPAQDPRQGRATPAPAVLVTRWSHGVLTATDGAGAPPEVLDQVRC